MSNRSQLVTIRKDLADIDRRIDALSATGVPSVPRIQIGRAQAMLRAASGLVANALRLGVDAVVEHPGAAR